MKKHSMLGFTLIELMISLTLGLVIMLAAMQLLLTNQMSFNLQSGMGNVQENGRFALDYINSTVRSAEYSQDIANPDVGIVTDISQLPGVTNVALVTRNDLTL
ncbi:MAG: prepilin-type N-terminal cleavage/methylation domain-containing protein [Moraxellaceae bacterium]|nr:prepilin-type N-terminal cleavage/methylation domain-containing protein [Moraxellaceae bacterium]